MWDWHYSNGMYESNIKTILLVHLCCRWQPYAWWESCRWSTCRANGVIAYLFLNVVRSQFKCAATLRAIKFKDNVFHFCSGVSSVPRDLIAWSTNCSKRSRAEGSVNEEVKTLWKRKWVYCMPIWFNINQEKWQIHNMPPKQLKLIMWFSRTWMLLVLMHCMY